MSVRLQIEFVWSAERIVEDVADEDSPSLPIQ